MAAADRDASATSAPLAGPWTFAWTAPGAAADPAALDALGPRWLPAVVPGTVAGALRALAATGALDGVAPPARLDGADWWFRCRFAAPPPAPGERLSLRFDGLATIAEVFLNGAPLLRSENMFVASAAEIGDRLRDGNDLVMRFAALDPLLAARRPRPRWRAPMVEHQQLRWFRTTLLGRTPGWSPPAPPVGPWRPVRLQRARAFAVQSRDLRVSLQGDTGLVAVTLQLESLGGARLGGGRLVVTGADGRAREAPLAPRFPEGAGPVSLSATVSIPGAAVWWPHTHGAQPLYAARAQIDVAGADPLAVELGRVGFRTVGLATEGGDFALSVNGTPIFCRGACWTPVDAVSLADAPDALRETLLAARDAGMNMVRVCGPLLYESDTFHDLCDQLGILVWQDFMFANMDYPEDAAFVASVKAEAEQALRRWQARPSLGVLCGDSEGEQQAAMWGAPRAAWHRPLFRETLAALARALCPDVPYWPSSASGGAFPHQPSAGTTSYYGVGAYRRPLEDARRCNLRFASECLGFGNIPDDAALAALASGAPVRPHTPSWKAGVPRDPGAGWDFDDVRDHYLALLFGLDPVKLRGDDPERYLLLGRVVTGEAMAATLAEWRRPGSTCRGALVWFLRDLVPGAGWGLLDFAGGPKAAYHYACRALQPLALFISDEGLNGTDLHAVNDHATPWRGTLDLALYRDGEVRVGGGATEIDVPARGGLTLSSASLLEGFRDTTAAYHFGPPDHDLAVARLMTAGGDVAAQAFHFPVGRARAIEDDLGLQASAAPLSDGDFLLTVATRRFAQAIAIDVSGFVPGDNYFHLAPGGRHQTRLRRAGAAGDPRGHLRALNARAATRIGAPA